MKFTLSKKMIDAVKLAPVPQYKLALQIGVHPNYLSKILNGALFVKKDNPRLVMLGDLLGVKPREIFVRWDEKKGDLYEEKEIKKKVLKKRKSL